jgi:hypothetical protein
MGLGWSLPHFEHTGKKLAGAVLRPLIIAPSNKVLPLWTQTGLYESSLTQNPSDSIPKT